MGVYDRNVDEEPIHASADAGSVTTADLLIACFTERYCAWDYKAHFRASRGIAYNAEFCPDSDGSLSHSSDSIMTFFAGAECGGIGARAIVRDA